MAMNPQLMALLQMLMGGGDGDPFGAANEASRKLFNTSQSPFTDANTATSDLFGKSFMRRENPYTGGGGPGPGGVAPMTNEGMTTSMGTKPLDANPGLAKMGNVPVKPPMGGMPNKPMAGMAPVAPPKKSGPTSEAEFQAMYDRMMRAQLQLQQAALRGNAAAGVQAEQLGQMIAKLQGDWDLWRTNNRTDTLAEEERSRQQQREQSDRYQREREQKSKDTRRQQEERKLEAEERRDRRAEGIAAREEHRQERDKKSSEDEKGASGDGDGGKGDKSDEFMGMTKDDFAGLDQRRAYALAQRLVTQFRGGGAQRLGPGQTRPQKPDSKNTGKQSIPGWLLAILEAGPGGGQAAGNPGSTSTPGMNTGGRGNNLEERTGIFTGLRP